MNDIRYIIGNVGTDRFNEVYSALIRGYEVQATVNGVVRAKISVRLQSSADTRESRFVLTGRTGVHALDYQSTDAERLLSHVAGFVANQYGFRADEGM